MPNAPRADNTAHTIRAPRDEWEAALEEAARRREPLSAYLRRAIRHYNAGGDIPTKKRAPK
jgi:hypothetical protein